MDNNSRNLLLTLRYDGLSFHGWQYQPNCRTVEDELKKAIKRKISGNEIVRAKEEKEPARVINIMEALQKSLVTSKRKAE